MATRLACNFLTLLLRRAKESPPITLAILPTPAAFLVTGRDIWKRHIFSLSLLRALSHTAMASLLRYQIPQVKAGAHHLPSHTCSFRSDWCFRAQSHHLLTFSAQKTQRLFFLSTCSNGHQSLVTLTLQEVAWLAYLFPQLSNHLNGLFTLNLSPYLIPYPVSTPCEIFEKSCLIILLSVPKNFVMNTLLISFLLSHNLLLLTLFTSEFSRYFLKRILLGLAQWLNWLILYLPRPASHMDAGSCSGCSTSNWTSCI